MNRKNMQEFDAAEVASDLIDEVLAISTDSEAIEIFEQLIMQAQAHLALLKS